jgi:predicted Zn-dependent protease
VSPAARIALAAAALAAIAWLSIGVRAAHLATEGHAVASAPERVRLAPGAVSRAERELRDAEQLVDDRDAAADRASLLARGGHPEAATALARRLTREEPDNVAYWFLLARVARRADPALARRAAARALELRPDVGPPI